MKCPNCEAEIKNAINQKFCESCGFELNLKENSNREPLPQINPVKTPRRRRCC